MKQNSFSVLCSAFAASTLFSVTAAVAQNATGTAPSGVGNASDNIQEVQEILVTAQRREEKSVDVPISITSIGPDQLVTANVQGLADIARLTPSLRFDTQDGFYQPTIRGIGTSLVDAGGGSNVGIYIDGFFSPNPMAADFQVLNVSSVQVLKGPQGTLFGQNTTGGAILVTTSDPSAESHAQVTASYGRFNTQSYQAYATTGIGDRLAFNVAGVFSKGNGFLTNIVDGDKDAGAYQNWTVRTGLKFDVTDNVSIIARYTRSRVNDPTSVNLNSNTDTSINLTTGRPWGIQTLTTGPYTTDPDQVANDVKTYLHTTTDIAQLTVRADLNFANLTSYSQWRREDSDESVNLDQTALPGFQLGLSPVDRTVSQEFVLSSKTGSALQWTAGAFFFSNRDTYTTYLDTFVNTSGRLHIAGSSSTPESYAGYLDATYELTPKLFLTAGARYSHDAVKDAWFYSNFTFNKNDEPNINSSKVTPRVVIRYKPTDQSSVYASFTEGYKAAIIDIGGSCENPPNFNCNKVSPETVNAFEVGYKFETHGFSNEAAAYYYNYKNLQISEFLVIGGVPVASIINAAQSRIYGLEDEFHFDLNSHFQVNGGASWTHARYHKFGEEIDGSTIGAPIYATCPADVTTLPARYAQSCGGYAYVNFDSILTDVHMQHAPDFTANLGPRFTTGSTSTGEYSFGGNLAYSSKVYMGPSGTQFVQPSYTTLNLRAEWKDPSERYTVAVYGDNVTNERYRTQVSYNGLGIGAGWSAPVIVGIQLGAQF